MNWLSQYGGGGGELDGDEGDDADGDDGEDKDELEFMYDVEADQEFLAKVEKLQKAEEEAAEK